MEVDRFKSAGSEQSLNAEMLCKQIERKVEQNPGVAVAVTAFAGFAAGLIVSSMANDVVRARRNSGLLGNWRQTVESALQNALPSDLKDRFS